MEQREREIRNNSIWNETAGRVDEPWLPLGKESLWWRRLLVKTILQIWKRQIRLFTRKDWALWKKPERLTLGDFYAHKSSFWLHHPEWGGRIDLFLSAVMRQPCHRWRYGGSSYYQGAADQQEHQLRQRLLMIWHIQTLSSCQLVLMRKALSSRLYPFQKNQKISHNNYVKASNAWWHGRYLEIAIDNIQIQENTISFCVQSGRCGWS